MKNTIPYKKFPSFILRTPFFPYNILEKLSSGQTIDEESRNKLYNMSEVAEAIWLASPSLSESLEKWKQGEKFEKKYEEQFHNSMLKYLSRMAFRSTPFGLFAGFCMGSYDKETDIVINSTDQHKRHTRLDMNYLCALAQDLDKNSEIRPLLKYYPNSSAYRVGDKLRYIEYKYNESRRTHHLVSVDYSEYIEKVLQQAANGALLTQLAEILVDNEITYDEANQFVNELVDSQLLVSELEPAITGEEFMHQIFNKISKIETFKDKQELINSVLQKLDEIDSKSIGKTVGEYLPLAEELKKLDTKYELKYLYQTDMLKSSKECQLSEDIVNDVLKAFEFYNKVTQKAPKTAMTEFRDKFVKRYETRELPLAQVLDAESGIGYGNNGDGDFSPLVDGFGVANGGEGSQAPRNRIQPILFKKYLQAYADKSKEVEFTDDDLKDFKADWSDTQSTISAMISLVGTKNEKPLISLSGMGGSSAANLLGRFCHADENLYNFTKEIKKQEEALNSDVIMAEIVHLPESRVGNILLHPEFHSYEIPYLAKSSVADEFRLPIWDLYVSVKNNRVVLRSKKLNKEILPRLSNAHNFSMNALPVYHFLCDLQFQNLRSSFGFGWIGIDEEVEFLPRLSYKNIIFEAAIWKVKKEEIKEMIAIKDDKMLMDAVKEWQTKRELPDLVILPDGDNEMFVNLQNLQSVKNLLATVKNRGGFKLAEFIFDKENGVVKDENGQVFTNEFILTFYKDSEKEDK